MVLKEVEDTQPTPERGSVTSSSELRHRETSGSDDEVGQTVPVLTEAEPSDSPSRPTPASKNLQKPSYSRMKELDMARCVVRNNHNFFLSQTSQDFLQLPAFQLVQHLTRRTHTDVEAAYVIFRWVTCQTINKHQAGQPEVDGATTSTLATFVAQLNQEVIDHSDLYSHLCRFANLETHKITGVVRHFNVPDSCPAVSVTERQLVSCPAIRRLGSCGLQPGVQVVAAESAIREEQGGGCGQ
ncbi:hypothetical protein C0Q70_06191 [Pomacea canaliculata]|uniref:Uncharacterized protein n=1 Tax=Pomacea canaliculata TaxID=400727 RepID=A0A2T7PNB4_POMCA|nr:hypothetical protein C0Q70_06191 [Pomacea canaliculata]